MEINIHVLMKILSIGEWETFNLLFSQNMVLHLTKTTHFLNIERKKNEWSLQNQSHCFTKCYHLLIHSRIYIITRSTNQWHMAHLPGHRDSSINGNLFLQDYHHNRCLTQLSRHMSWNEKQNELLDCIPPKIH